MIRLDSEVPPPSVRATGTYAHTMRLQAAHQRCVRAPEETRSPMSGTGKAVKSSSLRWMLRSGGQQDGEGRRGISGRARRVSRATEAWSVFRDAPNRSAVERFSNCRQQPNRARPRHQATELEFSSVPGTGEPLKWLWWEETGSSGTVRAEDQVRATECREGTTAVSLTTTRKSLNPAPVTQTRTGYTKSHRTLQDSPSCRLAMCAVKRTTCANFVFLILCF